MYPDWPESKADLLPLPPADGPKLAPFDFQGEQNIEFLENVGSGRDSYVFKVRILGKIYALKVFRFGPDREWLEGDEARRADREYFTALHSHNEPFNCECRAFGRLQEAGHEDLAIKCYGYVLLSEKDEHFMITSYDLPSFRLDPELDVDLAQFRARFPAKGGRLPPYRAILKDFGTQEPDHLTTALARKAFNTTIKLHKLGIVNLDMGYRQFINDKLVDFSTAKTTPHRELTTELNPNLSSDMVAEMDLHTFRHCADDYRRIDDMSCDWERRHPDKRQIDFSAFPGRGTPKYVHYDFRNGKTRSSPYVFVDPRKFDWAIFPSAGPWAKGNRKPPTIQRLTAKTDRWYYNGRMSEGEELRTRFQYHGGQIRWDYKDGKWFPHVSTPQAPISPGRAAFLHDLFNILG